MREIPLNPVPNQRLQITIDDNRWDLTIKVARNIWYVIFAATMRLSCWQPERRPMHP